MLPKVLGPDDVLHSRLRLFFFHPQRRGSGPSHEALTHELSFFTRLCLMSSLFYGTTCMSTFLCGTCGAPRVIAPWRGEREWFPVSNPALCRAVDMREDGRSQRLFRGRRVLYRRPLAVGSPIWGLTAHVGGRAPSRAHTWVSPVAALSLLWLFLSFSALRPHVSHFECPVLRKGQLNRHTRYRPATTTRNTATQWSRRSVG